MSEQGTQGQAVDVYKEAAAGERSGKSKRERRSRSQKEVSFYLKSAIEVIYAGSLSDSEKIFCHFGYGKDWSNQTTLEMTKLDGKWVCAIPYKRGKKIQFCFKNNNNDWDNNGGLNWSTTTDIQSKH